MTPNLLITGTHTAKVRFLCAHGAGAAMDSSFLNLFAALLAERHVCTIRFEFKYMAARRDGGKRRPPPRADGLMPEYMDLIDSLATSGPPLVVGGKSMGGRVASMVADEAFKAGKIKGLVCLGYPFHPPKKPDQLRTAHLIDLACPALLVQGERDPFGSRSEVEALSLSRRMRFHWAADGDHDLGPRGNSGFTRKSNLAASADAVAQFAREVAACA